MSLLTGVFLDKCVHVLLLQVAELEKTVLLLKTKGNINESGEAVEATTNTNFSHAHEVDHVMEKEEEKNYNEQDKVLEDGEKLRTHILPQFQANNNSLHVALALR